MELDDLYQRLLRDHSKNPRNRRALSEDEIGAEEENPTCGDRLRIAVSIEDGIVEGIAFDGKGCIISIASASMMTERLKGMQAGDALALAARFVDAMNGKAEMTVGELGDLAALDGVKKYPMRIKCATLAWQGVRKALSTHASKT